MSEPFWAIVELMGHQRLAGKVEETELAGSGFLRIDVPGKNGGFLITRFVSPSAVYAINPVAEELAREVAGQIESAPVHSYDVPKLADKLRQEIQPEEEQLL